MKKILIVILLFLCSSLYSLSQSLEMLQQLSPKELEQLNELQKNPSSSSLPKQEVTRIGDRTSRVRSYAEADTTIRTTIGSQKEDSKWEKIYRQNGSSTTLPTVEYIEFLQRKERDSLSVVFGHNIFNRENLTFAPSLSIPTPLDYEISAGDVLIITLWGASEGEYEMTVSPEGNINIPTVGVIKVGGLSVESAENRIRSRFAATDSSSSAVRVKVTLGDIRSITVNIVGEAFKPGTYVLPSLSTVFNALYQAGGINEIGSVRDIKLYRQGKLIGTLDVYDYLINGSNKEDQRLQDNDLIVVSPNQNIVTITGKVKRPMQYELKNGESIEQLLKYTGGFTGDAYSQRLALSRKSGGKEHSMHTVDKDNFAEFILTDKDSIDVGTIVARYANRVSIEGAVWRSGNYQLGDSIKTVKELINAAEGLREDAFAGRAQIIRTLPDMSLEIIPLNINDIIMGRKTDIKLQKNDRIIVTSINDLREGKTISIAGEVNDPHTMPYAKGMTIGDAIILAKGLKNSASLARIEVVRRVKNNSTLTAELQRAKYFSFQMTDNLKLNGKLDSFVLEPYDQIFIRKSPGYKALQIIEVDGEVNFEGKYAMITVADKLSDLVNAAGGVTQQAFLNGASLYRKYGKRDLEKHETIENILNVVNKNPSNTIVMETTKVGEYYTIGIDLAKALSNPNSPENITLMDGDRLFIPTMDNTVTITGAVYYPNTTTYNPKFTVKQYINQAGGYSTQAKKKPFIVYMNGKVLASNTVKAKPEAGCTIVVPFKEFREPMSVQGWVGVSSSIVSMAAMVVSLITK